jgi:bacterioferritin (cytochrome b1)
MDVEETVSVSNAVNQGTMLQEKENMIEELKAKLEESQTAFKELKEVSVYCENHTEQTDTLCGQNAVF